MNNTAKNFDSSN